MDITHEPLTAHQFRSVVKRRGWSLGELAARWGITAARVSQIVNQPEKRPRHWEDALFGLPNKVVTERSRKRRQLLAREAGAGVPVRRGRSESNRAGHWVKQEPYLAQGSIFVTEEDQGEHLPYGCRGAVVARRGQPATHVCVLFETGYLEWFAVDWIARHDSWLVYNGVTAPSFARHVYINDAAAIAALRRRELIFD